MDCPLQIVAEFTTTVGLLITVTVVVPVLTQPFALVPVTVYEVVEAGLAFTFAPVVALNPVAGLQVYVLAPPAVSGAEAPLQTVPGVTVIVGNGLTETTEVTVPRFCLRRTTHILQRVYA